MNSWSRLNYIEERKFAWKRIIEEWASMRLNDGDLTQWNINKDFDFDFDFLEQIFSQDRNYNLLRYVIRYYA